MMDVMLEHALQVNDSPGIELLPSERPTDLEHADEVLLLSDDVIKLQRLSDLFVCV